MFNIQFLFLAVGIVCLLLILSAIRSYLKFQKAKIELITFKTICEEKNSQIKNLQEKTSLLEKDKEELVKINGKLSATIEYSPSASNAKLSIPISTLERDINVFIVTDLPAPDLANITML